MYMCTVQVLGLKIYRYCKSLNLMALNSKDMAGISTQTFLTTALNLLVIQMCFF